MQRLVALATLAFLLMAALPGCTDDCDKLTDAVCTRLGEDHEACKRARKRNENASQDDKRLCGEALALTQRLTPKN